MILLRWRCRACSAPWATSMPGETRCPFCGSQDIEGPINARRARIMDVQRKLRRNRTRPLDHVRGGAYPTSRIRRRAVRVQPHADAGKVRPLATSAQAPLRPSEGLLVSCAGKACPPQWRTPGPRARGVQLDGESTNMGPRNGKLRLEEVRGKGLTANVSTKGAAQ